MNCKTLRIRLSETYRESDEASACSFLESVEVANVAISFLGLPEPQWSILVFFERREVEVPAWPSGSVEIADDDLPLFESLKAWRSERAAADGVPAYVVAHNRTLAEIARLRPSTREQLGGIKGFGRTRLDKFGEGILSVVERNKEVGAPQRAPTHERLTGSIYRNDDNRSSGTGEHATLDTHR